MSKQNLEEAITKYKNIEEYTNNPTYKFQISCASTLAQTIPVLGTLLTETAEKGLEMYRDSAKRKLIDSILEYEDQINPAMIDGVSFIMEFAKTQEVITKLANHKKLDYFTNLFCNYFILECHYNNVDIFEEYLEHLSTLSFREIDLLICLYSNEVKTSGKHFNSMLDRRKESYAKFKEEISKKGIDRKQLEGMLISITRSGFVKETVGMYMGYEGGVYHTTAYFHNFLSYITKRDLAKK